MPSLPDLAIERLKQVEGLGRIYEIRGSLIEGGGQKVIILASPTQQFDINEVERHQKLTTKVATAMADLVSFNSVTRALRENPRFKRAGSLVLGRVSFNERIVSSTQGAEMTGTPLDEEELALWLNSQISTVKISRTLPEGFRRYIRNTDVAIYHDEKVAWVAASYQERAWQGSIEYDRGLAALTHEFPERIVRGIILGNFPPPLLHEELQRTHPYTPFTG